MKAKFVFTCVPKIRYQPRIEYCQYLPEVPVEPPPEGDKKVVFEVSRALQRLTEQEEDIVERFHFYGQSCREIAAALKLSELRVWKVLFRARRKLYHSLAPFVQSRYRIPIGEHFCPICDSKRKKDMEKLLNTKTKEESWKRILRQLKTNFRVRTNAQNLNRHLTEHLPFAKKKPKGNTI